MPTVKTDWEQVKRAARCLALELPQRVYEDAVEKLILPALLAGGDLEKSLEAMKDRDYEPIKQWIEQHAPEAVQRAWALMTKAEAERDAAEKRARSALTSPSPTESGELSSEDLARLRRWHGREHLAPEYQHTWSGSDQTICRLLDEIERLRTDLEKEREECALEAEKAAKFSIRWQGVRLELARVRTKLKARLARALRAAFHPRRVRDLDGDWQDAGYRKQGVWSSRSRKPTSKDMTNG